MSEESNAINPNSMTIIVTKGSLDWAYPPFILSTTAAAMGLDVTMFFTFYGLPLLLKKMDLKVTPLGNAAMKMPMAGAHMVMPNLVAAIPGVDGMATLMPGWWAKVPSRSLLWRISPPPRRAVR